MIPIQLTIEGLYSYQERQTINFANLTEAGLFGIFGSVGSGKSSILEAISFALYGETERLNMRDKRAYNMMNLKSNSSYIAFDFVNHENKLFRVTRDFKRNSKKFEDVKPSSVTFYENKDEKWIPLDHSDAEKVIGLSYSNFKRTIIIPQGQFKEFLELGAADRTNMMKEIFNLQRFDLQNNVSNLNAKNRSELDQLQGELKGFEEIDEEHIRLQKENLKTEQQKFSDVKKEHLQVSEKYQQLKILKTDFENLRQKKEEFEKISTEKAKIDELEKKTDLYDTTFRIFDPLLNEKKKLSGEISERQKELEIRTKSVEETEKSFNLIKEKLVALQPQFDALDQSKIQENDLGLILQMLQFSEEIKTLRERTQKGAEKVLEVEEKQKLGQSAINTLTKEADRLKPQKIEANVLVSVGNWFVQNRNLRELQQKQSQKLMDQQDLISKILNDLIVYKIDTENFREDFKLKTENLENKKKNLQQKLDHLKIQKELSRFATKLHDGENCPLCGSLEHPHIIEFHYVDTELNEVQEEIQLNDHAISKIQKEIAEIEKILDRKKIFEDQLKAEQESFDLLQKESQLHVQRFIWNEFSADGETDFEFKRQQSFAIEKQIEEINQKILHERTTFEKEQEILEKYKKALDEFKLEEAKKEEQIRTNQSNLKSLDWDDYRDKSHSEVMKLHQKLIESNLTVEKEYQALINREKEIVPKLAEEKAIASQLNIRISELTKETSLNEEALQVALQQQGFGLLTDVQNILMIEIDVHKTRTQIQQFRIQFETLKNGIQELEIKLKDFSYDQEMFEAAEKQLKDIELQLKEANDSVVKVTSEIERLEKEYKKKEALLKNLSELQKRSDNLKIMTNLFKGAGFVQYVSSIYLRQLCDHANVRFHRMTRNQLSLQLNDNNDFEIIDYLNEGKSRSVKTLSGGQAFQVSLSLALALAESVQATTKADKNFFFIDEGFGTQDLESVNIVFETLMGLQKENRIVGIISHVEELKEKIPVSLSIVKDEERGSLIEML
ncbi:SMC family ATPase [Chryseobacterium sp. B21-037]|uniref:AAA family ATPase n=1 Tax=unclassified Chryseobacterium TaxID=2593645 RepID=UPI0023599E80|nr:MULTISPECIES: SMC family ATPase [unclassified Chryseobacterium]MDC8106641.1 SMC family ATPase [Chryseobacterium sp. B21-037]MDQ1806082.1 SMC family ATPase [Chryseobacterium sp. CKR4-1]